jgi:polyvinyl alcohol dehydrogenase (cytochrome)
MSTRTTAGRWMTCTAPFLVAIWMLGCQGENPPSSGPGKTPAATEQPSEEGAPWQFDGVAEADRCTAPPASDPDLEAADAWTSWGGSHDNHRVRHEEHTRLDASNLERLEVQWAYGVPEVETMRSQPTVAGDWLFLAGADGVMRALDASRGCLIWDRALGVPVGAALTLYRLSEGTPVVIAGDFQAGVHVVDAARGELLWHKELSEHELARISGPPTAHDGTLYVPVSSDESAAVEPEYECCTFRGKVHALDAADGSLRWTYYTIDEEPRPRGEDAAGAAIHGPSGAAVWSAITIDVQRERLYFGTGNNYSQPATGTSSAIHAIDLGSGDRAWVFQGTEGDAWTMACGPDWRGEREWDDTNCPEDHGPDVDFGAAPLLVTSGDGRQRLIAGQKSGLVRALDPDDDGRVLWETRVGRGGLAGGVHFGMAVADDRIIVPVLDRYDKLEHEREGQPGVVALDAATGEILWRTPALEGICENRDGCFPGFSAPATVLPGAAIVGALDGYLQALALEHGRRLWTFDTVRDFDTVNDVPGHGGAMAAAGAIVTRDRLYVVSGYNFTIGQIPGNVLLSLALPTR